MADRPPLKSVLNAVGFVLVGTITLIDMAAGPVVRPLSKALTRSSPIAMLRRMSRRLPAYVALVCLILPLAVAEPAKVFALYLIGDGHYISGVGLMIAAYLVSLVLVDTIYEGARPQLRSITWFATIVDRVSVIRLAIVTRARETRAYRVLSERILRVRAWFGRRRARFAR